MHVHQATLSAFGDARVTRTYSHSLSHRMHMEPYLCLAEPTQPSPSLRTMTYLRDAQEGRDGDGVPKVRGGKAVVKLLHLGRLRGRL